MSTDKWKLPKGSNKQFLQPQANENGIPDAQAPSPGLAPNPYYKPFYQQLPYYMPPQMYSNPSLSNSSPSGGSSSPAVLAGSNGHGGPGGSGGPGGPGGPNGHPNGQIPVEGPLNHPPSNSYPGPGMPIPGPQGFPVMQVPPSQLPGFRPPPNGPHELAPGPPHMIDYPFTHPAAGSPSSTESQKDFNRVIIEEPAKKKQKKPGQSNRRRALTACNSCRVKKVKCDNVKPRCGSCMRAGVEDCVYNHEDIQRDMHSELLSQEILLRLDTIMGDLDTLKSGKVELKVPVKQPPSKCYGHNVVWDMSFSTMLQWPFFSEKVPDILDGFHRKQQELLLLYNATNHFPAKLDLNEALTNLKTIEEVMIESLPKSINSFFVNCHTKVPVLDILDFLESIEILKIFYREVPGFSMMNLVSEYHKVRNGKELNSNYVLALQKSSIKDPVARVEAFNSLCEKLPLIPVVCALGVLSSPIQLDNFSKYKCSLEERIDLSTSCLSQESIEKISPILQGERLSVSLGFITFSKIIIDFFPDIYKEYSTNSILYNLFLNQFYLYILKPVTAYRYINLACQDTMFTLEKMKGEDDEIIYKDEKSLKLFQRVFWVCLKLECELRSELSPHVPSSGIVDIQPPCSFPTIPDPIINEAESVDHSPECVQIATKFDDQYTWYYFLTEVAIRKVDNELFNEFYSVEAKKSDLWNNPKFYNETFWISFVKYNNQYNGIINSLSPRIRNFILKEVDVTQVFKLIARAHENRENDGRDLGSLVSENLDDFLIDDNLIIQAQSESIMYIKTRVLTSKLLLLRPITYLILHDRISPEDLIEGILALFADDQNSSVDESQSTSNSDFSFHRGDTNIEYNYDKILEAPLYYQKNNIHENFTDFFTNEDGKPSESNFKLNRLHEAKQKTIKTFFINLKSIPKLNIPKIGGHRHPGQWYYLRNLLIGNMQMFLLYKKFIDMLSKILSNDNFRHIFEANPMLQSMGNLSGLLDAVLPKEMLVSTLEHAKLVFKYWVDECQDCKIYIEIVEKCLANI